MKISIITAVYNNEDYIERTIQSVLSQTYEPIEYLVIDGYSTDQTVKIIESYRDQIDFFRSEKDDGIYNALNKGIENATGNIIGFLHSDDFYHHANVITTIAKAFENKSVNGVYGDLNYVMKNKPDQIIRYWKSEPFDSKKLLRGWMPPHPTLYLQKSIYEKYGIFDTTYTIAADYDFILRVLSKHDIRIEYLDEVLVNMRMGGASNRSFKNIIHKSYEDYCALKKNNIGGFKSLLWKNIRKIPQYFDKVK